MDTTEAIQTRRAVKHYDPAHVMSEQEQKVLLELAMLSPTSFNIQNWRFLNVRDKALRASIRGAAWDQAQVTDASMLVLVCADLTAHSVEPGRYWRNAPEAVQNMLVPMIGTFYDGNTSLVRDEAMRSVGIASQTIMLAARAQGLDSCPMIGFDPVQVGELVKLPEAHVIGMMIAIGKAAQPAQARGGQLDYDEVVATNTF